MGAPVRVGVYCRISIDPNGLRIGVERQRRTAWPLGAERWPGWVVEEFVDNDISAADPTTTRPRWLDRLAGLRAGEIDEVVAYDQSRLTCQPAEWGQLLVIVARRRIASIHAVRRRPEVG